MKDKTIQLRQLLELASGQMPELAQANLQSQIARHPLWCDRWNRLRSLVNNSSTARSWTNPDVHPELVAAYLDRRLPDTRSTEFEECCWADHDLLSEVVCLYLEQSIASGNGRTTSVELPLSIELSRRLMALPLGVSNRSPRTLKASAAIADINRHGSEPLVRAPLPARHQQVVSTRTFAFSVACLLMALLFATSYGMWRYYRPFNQGEPTHITHSDPLPSEPVDVASDSRQPATDDLPETPAPPHDPLANLSDSTKRNDANENPPGDIPQRNNSPHLAQSPQRIKPSEPIRIAPANPNENTLRADIGIALPWEPQVGLFAWRSLEENSPWQGPKSLPLGIISPLIQVLPQSLASCSLPVSGQIYARGDSLFSLSATMQEQTLASRVQLLRGTLAFVDMPPDFALTFQWEESHVSIVSLSESATWEVEWVNETPCLFVSNGEVDVEGIRVRASQYYDLQIVGTGAAQPANEKRVEWWKNETPMTTWSRTSRERLADSHDLSQDLLTFAHEGTRQQQILANHWLVSLAPEKHLLVALEHRDLRVREHATSWLLNLPTAERPMQRYWRQLLVDQVRPTQLRALMNLGRANRSRAPVSIVELEPVIESLDHAQLAIRQVAATLLEQRFGNPANYRADATDPIRQSSARAWVEWIRKSMVRTRQ